MQAYLTRLMKDQGVPQKALPRLQPAGIKLLLRREILQGDKDGRVRSRCYYACCSQWSHMSSFVHDEALIAIFSDTREAACAWTQETGSEC